MGVHLDERFAHIPRSPSQMSEAHGHVVPSECDRASKWSDKVLNETFKDLPVLHHVCLAAYECRVYDSNAGSQKDLYLKASSLVDSDVLSQVTFEMRVGTVIARRRSAPLKWDTMKSVVEKEMARVAAFDDDAKTDTGMGDDPDPEAHRQREHETTVRHLIEMKIQYTASRNNKKRKEETHAAAMADMARDLLRRADEADEPLNADSEDDQSESTKPKSLASGFKGISGTF